MRASSAGISAFAVIFMLVNSGCSYHPHVNEERTSHKTIPAWYQHTPQNSEAALFGVGEGPSHKEAVASALADLSSRLSASVSSKFNVTRTSLRNGYELHDSRVDESVTLQSDPLSFVGYEVRESFVPSWDRHAVLVAVPKAALMTQLDQSVVFFLSMATEGMSVAAMPLFSKLKLYRDLLEQMREIERYDAILAYLGGMSRASLLSQLHQDIAHAERSVRSSVAVITRNASGPYEGTVVAKLARSGVLIADNPIDGKENLRLVVEPIVKRSQSGEFFITSASVLIKTLDSNRVIASGRSIQCKGVSALSRDIADKTAENECEKKLENLTSEEIIGF